MKGPVWSGPFGLMEEAFFRGKDEEKSCVKQYQGPGTSPVRSQAATVLKAEQI